MSLPTLIIVGVGDFAREVLAAALENPACGRDWTLGGFLDDDVTGSAQRLTGYGIDLPVVGPIAGHQPAPDHVFICAIGAPAAKLQACAALRTAGARFINLIHPTAQVGPRCRLGTGLILMYQAGLTCDVTVGDFVSINRFSSVGHDAVLGDGCTLSSYCDVTGRATLGRGVFMGSHASVLPRAQVGEFCTVGAGSVVVRRAPAGKTVLGVPAKTLHL